MTETTKVSSWRIILAFILDLIFSFSLIGYIIAKITGNTTETGFSLNGAPALLVFALVIFYFVLLCRYGGGTVFQRLLKAKRS